MFIYTAKLEKRKAILAVLLLAALICGVILIAGVRSAAAKEAGALSAIVKTNEQRVQYLQTLGWEVDPEPLETQSIRIPREFNDVYETYNQLQLEQGFDLRDYCGMEATRYTYKVINYAESDDFVVADLIVCQNELIAGDIQSAALDGFMIGLQR